MNKVKINVSRHYSSANKIQLAHQFHTDQPTLICNAEHIKIGDEVLKIMSYDVILYEDDSIDYIILNVL
jgi:hypothetical protein